ncbi:transposable element Tcb2 transposase [Trichonephila clavipes]|nr:transposable element Tcb2 transposase [Trichonephila clavipes]
MQGCLYTGSSSRQTIDGCVCNGLMSTKPGKLIGTKLSFQMNHASICGIMIVIFVLGELYLLENRYVREVLQLQVVPFLQGIPGAMFQHYNAHPHVAKSIRDFCSAQHMQLLPWSAYSPDMSPIEHVVKHSPKGDA